MKDQQIYFSKYNYMGNRTFNNDEVKKLTISID